MRISSANSLLAIVKEEEPMSAPEHGTTAGGCAVVEHQTEETMAALLLAREGEDAVKRIEEQETDVRCWEMTTDRPPSL